MSEKGLKVIFRIERIKQDPEKAVLPCVVFINTNHESFKQERINRPGFMFLIGWWDIALRIGIVMKY